MFQYVKPRSTVTGLERAGVEDERQRSALHYGAGTEEGPSRRPTENKHTHTHTKCKSFFLSTSYQASRVTSLIPVLDFLVDLYTPWSRNRKLGSVWGPGWLHILWSLELTLFGGGILSKKLIQK